MKIGKSTGPIAGFGLDCFSFPFQVLECWEFSKALILHTLSLPLEDPSPMLSRSVESVSPVESRIWPHLSELLLFSVLAV